MTDKQAKEFTMELQWLNFINARRIMREGLADPGTWQAYHATVAMLIHDRTNDKRGAVLDRVAAEILETVFGMERPT